MSVMDSLRSATKSTATPAEQAAEREADLDQQIRTVEAEHEKRLGMVRSLERDLEETSRQRRLAETRRDTLGDPDPAGLDRKIAATIAREDELGAALELAREKILGTPALLAQLRDQKRLAQVDQNTAARQACADIIWRAAKEGMDDEPVLRRIKERQRIVRVALDREDELRRESSVCSQDQPASSIAPRDLWFGPDLMGLDQLLQNNHALLRGR